MSILDLSGSPRNLTNRRFGNNLPGSPNREPKPGAKLLSPRSQWRFASPRSDVLSSTILEDCREDENSSNASGEKSNKSSPRTASRSSNSPTQSIRSDNKSRAESSPSPSSCKKGMPRNSEAQKSYNSASQRLYDLRAQFFQQPVSQNKQKVEEKPPLETSF
nr:unnamed protein product [Callosobruchus chinensis]